MMNTMKGFFNPNNLDQSSRANDVIVVRHRDGSLHCTPFNVRFGRAKIWNSHDKVVQVEVNGELTAAFMKIGDGGEAYWLQPTYTQTAEPAASRHKHHVTQLYRGHDNSSAGVTGSPGEVDSSASSLDGADFAMADDYHVRPESPVDLWEAQAHPITAELAAHATVLDDNTPRAGSDDSLDCTESPSAQQPHNSPGSAGQQEANDQTASGHTPLLQGDERGRYKIVPEAIHSAGDAQEANLALQAMAAAEKAERRLSTRMPLDPYLKEQALSEFPDAAAEAPPIAPTLAEELNAAAAAASFTDEPLDLNASKRDMAHDTIEGGGDEYYLEPLDIDDYVELYGEEDLLENTSFTSADGTAAMAAGDKANQHKDGRPTTTPATVGGEKAAPGASGATTSAGAAAAGKNKGQGNEDPYFTRTLIPVQADILKLNLKDGCNHVRYLTRKSPTSDDVVAVTCNLFLWDYRDRIVVSDVDGTITKSDLWGHFYSMLGKGGEWTHPGICSLYSKIASNGYRMVYLTARSVTQIHQTKEYLWTLSQDGAKLPLGPVLTVPQKFFTALTQEVSKRSHIFKIACLTSLKDAFPPRMKPFFAGFGNRYNDVLSYVAVGVPEHKIFIIDPSSVLHVARVKQTYPNLAKLVDVTFPPVKRHLAHRHQPDAHGHAGGAGSGAASTASVGSAGSVFASSDDDDDVFTGSQASQDQSAGDGQSPLTRAQSAAFALVGNDLTRAKLNPDDRDTYHILSPTGGSPSAGQEPASSTAEPVVPGALAALTGDQAAAAAAVTITSGTVLPGKVTGAPGTASGSSGAAAGHATIARGIVVQGGTAPAVATTGLFVRPALHTAGVRASTAAGGSRVEPTSPLVDDVQEDADFSGYNFWRVDPRDIVTTGAKQAKTSSTNVTPQKASPLLAGAGAGASSTVASAQSVPRGSKSGPSSAYAPHAVRVSPPVTSTAELGSDVGGKGKGVAASGGAGGGGLFSFGFSRGNAARAQKTVMEQEEAAAIAAAKQRTHMHPDSLDYYFSRDSAPPTTLSGSGSSAARDLAERVRQRDDSVKRSVTSSSDTSSPSGQPTRSKSPSWAFWRRGNGASPAEGAAPQGDTTPSSTPTATITISNNTTAVPIPGAPPSTEVTPSTQVKPIKPNTVNLDELFEM